jgi:adenosylcobinamide-GDP ribazoletransferase
VASFLSALGFLTIIPAGKRAGERRSLASSVVFFPLVGLALGFILAGIDYGLSLHLPIMLSSALVVSFLIILTGALHFEGFVDTCDGLFGGKNRERRLEVMRKKDVGAYAVAGGVLLLILKFVSVSSLPVDAGRFWILALFPCMSRWGMTLALGLFPYVRQDGLGNAFRSSLALQVIAAGIMSLLAAGLLGGTAGLILFGIATAFALIIGWGISRMLGGLTGDTYGAINEMAEVVLPVIAIGIAHVVVAQPFWQGFP